MQQLAPVKDLDRKYHNSQIGKLTFNDKTKQKINLRYNITQGLIEKANGERTSITSEEIIFIYNKLVMATNLASTITIDNKKKKGYSKKLVSDKK